MKRSVKKGDHPDLSVVVPALNEGHRIQKTLTDLAGYLSTSQTMKSINVEVILVSADSYDDTHKIIERNKHKFASFRFIKPGRRVGKGRDVREGMLAARGRARIFMDADLATPLEYLEIFYKLFEESETDVIIGVRNLRKHHPGKTRRLVSMGGNLLYRILGGVWVSDSQCGFKLFSARAAKLCFGKLTILGWGFDMEVLSIAKVHNFDIESIQISNWVSVEGGAITKASILHNSVQSLHDLGRIFLSRVRGKY